MWFIFYKYLQFLQVEMRKAHKLSTRSNKSFTYPRTKRTEKASMLTNGKLNVISQEKQRLFGINPIIIDNVL